MMYKDFLVIRLFFCVSVVFRLGIGATRRNKSGVHRVNAELLLLIVCSMGNFIETLDASFHSSDRPRLTVDCLIAFRVFSTTTLLRCIVV